MRKLMLTCFLFYSAFSCEENEQVESLKDDDSLNYASISKALKKNLDDLGEGMRKQNKSFNNESDLQNVSSLVFFHDKDSKVAFQNNFERALLYTDNNNVKARQQPNILIVSQYEYEKLIQVDLLWKQSRKASDYVAGLKNLLQDIEDSDDSHKFPELTLFVISQIVAHEFIGDNLDLFGLANIKGREGSWWGTWGKCIAGIVGGAGSLGLTGLLGGSAIGTVSLPVIGTASGALVGGVGGIIFGGIAGSIGGGCWDPKSTSSCRSDCPVQYIERCSKEDNTEDSCIEEEDSYREGVSVDDAYPLFDLSSEYF
ncbi:MAG: hypothetical protein OXH57_05270 [Ekhidna sp.]|nr:hypothetical protein [Ekhidna sp.]